MIKRLSNISIALTFMVMGLAAYGENHYPPRIGEIIKKGTLVVEMPREDSFPFFMANKEGQLIGLDATIAQDIADRLGVKLVVDRTSSSYEDAITRVNENKADVALCHLTISLERATRVAFSEPYVLVKHVLLVNRLAAAHMNADDDRDLESRLTQKKITVGAKAGTYFAQTAKTDFALAELHTYPSDKELYTAVEKGEIQAVLTDEVSAKNWQYAHPTFSIGVRTILRKDRSGRIAMAVNWSSADFLSWLNLYIETAKSEHKLDQWTAEYLEESRWKSLLAK